MKLNLPFFRRGSKFADGGDLPKADLTPLAWTPNRFSAAMQGQPRGFISPGHVVIDGCQYYVLEIVEIAAGRMAFLARAMRVGGSTVLKNVTMLLDRYPSGDRIIAIWPAHEDMPDAALGFLFQTNIPLDGLPGWQSRPIKEASAPFPDSTPARAPSTSEAPDMTDKTPPKRRDYHVVDKTGKERIIQAVSQAQAIRHASRGDYTASLLDTDNALRLGGEGVKREVASDDESQAQLPLPDAATDGATMQGGTAAE